MIQIDALTKSFGAQVLFSGISFQINPRERVGVVGRNGHGKTTLFRILAGLEQPDGGSVSFPKHSRVGYVRQLFEFTKPTILKEAMSGLPEEERDHHWKAEKILAGLGFLETDMERPPSDFSGGFQVRLNLARVLVSEPDLLLLDEPTNYLDITSIRWIERFLTGWPHELMLITHDRGFMDKVVTHTLAIHRKKVRKIEGDTGKLYGQLAQEEEVHEKTRINEERKQRDMEQFISRFRAKARLANLVQSRIKTLAKMKKKEKLEAIKSLDFSFRSKSSPAKHVLTAKDLTFGYDDAPPLIRDFSLTVTPGERIGVVGPNGRGKTTLLKLLARTLAPRSGELIYHPRITPGFYEQTNVQSLNDSRTVAEEILYAAPDVDNQTARNIAGAMMFEGDAALKRIGVLSGGEKARVMLGKLLATPVNLLLLDEPTNHLDMDACDALLAAIDNFDGAVIMVTHNEMFLSALAERLIVFRGSGIQAFEGGYDEFIEKVGWEGESPSNDAQAETLPDTDDGGKGSRNRTARDRKALRRRRSELIAERARIIRPVSDRISHTEAAIEAREAELAGLHEEMQSASQDNDGSRIEGLAQWIHACRSEIDRLYDQLEQDTDKMEAYAAPYDEALAELESAES